jgi:hypothetical protein
MPTPILSSECRWAGPAMRVLVVPPNHPFERSRGRVLLGAMRLAPMGPP